MKKEVKKMVKLQLFNQQIANEYEDKIKVYLKEVLEENIIENSQEKIEEIYHNMLTYIKDCSAIIIGAFENEQLIGFIWLYERKINTERRYHINYFIVDSEIRNKGIGKKLINKAYEIAKQNNIKKIELIVTKANENALSFYEKQDFKTERVILCKEI